MRWGKRSGRGATKRGRIGIAIIERWWSDSRLHRWLKTGLHRTSNEIVTPHRYSGVMPLEDDEKFLEDHGWTWYLEALQFHRNHLTEEEKLDPAKDGIERAKVDYYRFAVSKLAEMQRKREGK